MGEVEEIDKKFINNNQCSTNFDSKSSTLLIAYRNIEENKLGIVEVQYKIIEVGNEITTANTVEVVTQTMLLMNLKINVKSGIITHKLNKQGQKRRPFENKVLNLSHILSTFGIIKKWSMWRL